MKASFYTDAFRTVDYARDRQAFDFLSSIVCSLIQVPIGEYPRHFRSYGGDFLYFPVPLRIFFLHGEKIDSGKSFYDTRKMLYFP